MNCVRHAVVHAAGHGSHCDIFPADDLPFKTKEHCMNRVAALLFIVFAFSILGVNKNTPGIKPSASAVADLLMLFRGREPAVEVMVNGEGAFIFAIDTGATDEARVDSSLVERLGLHISGTSTHNDGSNKKVRLGTVRLDSLSIGGLEFRNVKADTRDYNHSNLPH